MKRLFILLSALVAFSSPSPVLATSVADVESEFGVSDLTLVDGVPNSRSSRQCRMVA
jgi:hypothetical protein